MSDDASSSGPPVISGTNRTLTLSDAFNPGRWKEGNQLPAGQKQSIQAMSRELECYADEDDSPLELRFGQATGTLKVSVAQDTASQSSEGKVEFSVKADGRMVGTKTVGFKESAELAVPLAGVAAVKIEAKQVGEECAGQVTGLITKLVVAE